MIANYKKLVSTHSNINMIEDGLFESDTENWVELQNTLGLCIILFLWFLCLVV